MEIPYTTIKLTEPEIIGYSNVKTCAEVSILQWACANSIYKLDENSKYYSSSVDNPVNPNEGLTYMTFDTSIEKAVEIFEQWKRNQEVWAKTQWKPEDARIIYFNVELIK